MLANRGPPVAYPGPDRVHLLLRHQTATNSALLTTIGAHHHHTKHPYPPPTLPLSLPPSSPSSPPPSPPSYSPSPTPTPPQPHPIGARHHRFHPSPAHGPPQEQMFSTTNTHTTHSSCTCPASPRRVRCPHGGRTHDTPPQHPDPRPPDPLPPHPRPIAPCFNPIRTPPPPPSASTGPATRHFQFFFQGVCGQN